MATAEHERRGIGRAIVDAARRFATVDGYARISVSTGAANWRAAGLVRRLGFEAEDVTPPEPVTGC